jgi:hypothetical protein
MRRGPGGYGGAVSWCGRVVSPGQGVSIWRKFRPQTLRPCCRQNGARVSAVVRRAQRWQPGYGGSGADRDALVAPPDRRARRVSPRAGSDGGCHSRQGPPVLVRWRLRRLVRISAMSAPDQIRSSISMSWKAPMITAALSLRLRRRPPGTGRHNSPPIYPPRSGPSGRPWSANLVSPSPPPTSPCWSEPVRGRRT